MKTMFEPSENQQKIVMLWAPPRAISTLFEKTFLQRADTAVVHEPFCAVYYFSKWGRASYEGDVEELLDYDAQAALQRISSQVAPLVFVKEMAFEMLPYIDKDFFRSVINTFIVRPPREIIASVYKQGNYSFSEEEFGFTSLEEIWKIVIKEFGQEPIIVEANRFRRHPKEVLSRYCDRIGVKFDPLMLDFKIHELPLMPYQIQFLVWWETALNSTEIMPPPDTEVKVDIRPEHLNMIERAEKIYEKLARFAL